LLSGYVAQSVVRRNARLEQCVKLRHAGIRATRNNALQFQGEIFMKHGLFLTLMLVGGIAKAAGALPEFRGIG
jgi:hypothetical protein